MDSLLKLLVGTVGEDVVEQVMAEYKDTLLTAPNSCACGKCNLHFIPKDKEGSKALVIIEHKNMGSTYHPLEIEAARKFFTDCLAALDKPAEESQASRWGATRVPITFILNGVEYDVIKLKHPEAGKFILSQQNHPMINILGLSERAELYRTDKLAQVKLKDALADTEAVRTYRKHYPNAVKAGNE